MPLPTTTTQIVATTLITLRLSRTSTSTPTCTVRTTIGTGQNGSSNYDATSDLHSVLIGSLSLL
ncbi:hypothetical protein LTR86_002471, partial [Recurvomyces mirabilis]